MPDRRILFVLVVNSLSLFWAYGVIRLSLAEDLASGSKQNLLEGIESPLLRRLILSGEKVDGSVDFLLRGDVRALLSQELRDALRLAETSPARQVEPATAFAVGSSPEGYRMEALTFVACELYAASKNGGYRRRASFAVDRVRLSVMGKTVETWDEQRQDDSDGRAKSEMWIRFDNDGTPFLGQFYCSNQGEQPSPTFRHEAEARFVCGDVGAYLRGETVRLEWTEQSRADLRREIERFFTDVMRADVESYLKAEGYDKNLSLPMCRVLYEQCPNDDIFVSRDRVVLCQRGPSSFSVIVPPK